MKNVTIAIFILLLFIAGVVWLQIFLSKKDKRWPGLILPILCLLFSILVVLGMATFQNITTTKQIIDENGVVIEEVIKESQDKPMQNTASLIFQIVYVFILYNIPTLILLAIYAGCRGKRKKNLELEKMSIQDLE